MRAFLLVFMVMALSSLAAADIDDTIEEVEADESGIEDRESFVDDNLELLEVYDVEDDGVVSRDGVTDAVEDWRSESISLEDLRTVISAWREGKDGFNYRRYVDEGEGEDAPEINIEASSDQIEVGDTVDIEAKVNPSIAENSFSIEIEGPETASQSYETTSTTYSFTPETRGEYKAKINVEQGFISRIAGYLTGSGDEALAETAFTVTNPNIEPWESFCYDQGYDTDQVDEQINCIQNEIVPNYFEESTGSQPEIAESLCMDLLGFNYDDSEQSCAI